MRLGPLLEAVIKAGAIRTRPILLTAAALMVGCHERGALPPAAITNRVTVAAEAFLDVRFGDGLVQKQRVGADGVAERAERAGVRGPHEDRGVLIPVLRDADRMGLRLEGRPLELTAPREMISSAVNAGVVQVPPGAGLPSGVIPERRSGAMEIQPAAANSSVTFCTQSVIPKISWMTMTAGALSFRSGYAT